MWSNASDSQRAFSAAAHSILPTGCEAPLGWKKWSFWKSQFSRLAYLPFSLSLKAGPYRHCDYPVFNRHCSNKSCLCYWKIYCRVCVCYSFSMAICSKLLQTIQLWQSVRRPDTVGNVSIPIPSSHDCNLSLSSFKESAGVLTRRAVNQENKVVYLNHMSLSDFAEWQCIECSTWSGPPRT